MHWVKKDVLSLLASVVIVYNGDNEHIGTTSTALTWFEEWFFYLEFLWGRSSGTPDTFVYPRITVHPLQQSTAYKQLLLR
jgi:hypothetical protein